MAEPTHSQLSREIGELKTTVIDGQKEQNRRLGNLETGIGDMGGRVRNLEIAASWGKGAGWMLVKTGSILLLIAGAIAGWWKALN